MARIRSVKPEFWSDRKLAKQLSRDARLLYIALWNMADEHGRVQGDPRWVKGHCLPYDDDLGLGDIGRLVRELAAAGRVQTYEVDGDPYLFLPKLAEHQRLEPAKSASRLPPPPDESAPGDDSPDSAQIFSDKSAPIVVQHVAGSMEHGITSPTDSAPDDSPRKPEPPRADVDQLCQRLSERMVANGCKRPTVTEEWRRSARLLLDRDERPLAEAMGLLDWSQDHSFWRSNIRSLPKFRDQYDRLRLQRASEQAKREPVLPSDPAWSKRLSAPQDGAA